MASRTTSRPPHACSPRRSAGCCGVALPAAEGFSLVEVLVTIVILAFGMLGTVGMQAFALQANRDARLQTQAVALAHELAEAMRSNPTIAARTTAEQNPYLVSSPTMESPLYCISVSDNAAATGCQFPVDVARAEMTDWLTRVATELPVARVGVCFDSTPYDADGLAQWACTGTGTQAYIKIGWTRAGTDQGRTGSAAQERAWDSSSRPSVIFPVVVGSGT